MANSDKDVAIQLKYKTDTASASAAVQSAEKVQASLRGVADADKQVERASKQAAGAVGDSARQYQSLQRRLRDNRKEAEALGDAYDDLRGNLAAYVDEEERLLQQQGGIPSRGAGTSAGGVRDISGLLPVIGGELGEGLERIGIATADILDAGTALGDLAPNLLSSKAGIVGLGVAAAGLAAGLAILTAALQESYEQATRVANEVRATIAAQREAAEFARQATSEELQLRREEIATAMEAQRAELERIRTVRAGVDEQLASLGWFTGAVVTLTQGTDNALSALGEAEAEAEANLANLEAQMREFGDASLDVAAATNDATGAIHERIAAEEALKIEQEAALETMRRVGTELSKQADREAAEAAQAAEDKAESIRERMIQERLRSEEEAAAESERIAKEKADIEKKRADDIIKITEKAAQAAEETLRDLRRDLAQLATEAERDMAEAEREARRDELQLAIEDQREAAQNLRRHLSNMQKIRADAQDREFELILEGDYKGLYLQRRQTRRRLEEESGNFSSQEQERQIQLQAERDDLARNLAVMRQERLIALSQEIADANLAARQKLADIKTNQAQELAAVRESASAQLAVIAETEQQKVELVKQGAMGMKAALASGLLTLGQGAKQPGSYGGLSQGALANILNRSNTLVDNSKTTINSGAGTGALKKMMEQTVDRKINTLLKKS